MRIDAHQHFWIYNQREYDWIDETMAAIRRDFLPADLRPELEDAGFDVIEAADGDDALQQFEDHALVTTLFADINMPGSLDGLSLAHRVFDLRPSVQLILTSGRGAPHQSEMPTGSQFLAKPYDCNRLARLIRTA